jgi:hypothetical protein
MARFRIHKMKEHVRQNFRWAPHTSGLALLKPRDYEPGGEVEAAGFYGAWMQLRGSASPLEVGDVLESEDGSLRICKYVGFEEARWREPEPVQQELAGDQVPASA